MSESHLVEVDVLFRIGDTVYRRLCKEEDAGLVTGLVIRENRTIIYLVTWLGEGENPHYGFELTGEFVPDYVSNN